MGTVVDTVAAGLGRATLDSIPTCKGFIESVRGMSRLDTGFKNCD